MSQPFRKTTQELMPAAPPPATGGRYDIYPGHAVGAGKIELGYEALAAHLIGHKQIIIDGYPGVMWSRLREQLNDALVKLGVRAVWQDVKDALRPQKEIEALVAPFLGGDDPIFGTRFTHPLSEFFDAEKLSHIKSDSSADVNIVCGCGATLTGWDGVLVYVDVPKNEIQFRFRANSVTHLDGSTSPDAKSAYKRAYFVDWVAANNHKADLLPRMDWVVDEQRPAEPAITTGDTLRAALRRMSRNGFRVRPWFEPGPWGGQWIKEKIPQLPQDPPNYAWSFELIVPENGLLLESDGRLLEVSFDFLMFHDSQAVVGESAKHFGYEFPIRFDFLDTFDGGNLSVQCHPRPVYIRRHFGETFTQDETYYILDCKPNAEVYLGFTEDCDLKEFRAELERSFTESTPVDIKRFVNIEPAKKHDLFLIPNGTIHCSGIDNLVLEISATPYIFTFKMYDWLRLDLEGRPRPLNLERAFDNLYFDRKGARVKEELVSQPRIIHEDASSRLIHLPTHLHHFYDVHRLEFTGELVVETQASCHILSLVEGQSVIVETQDGWRQQFDYAETFVISAAAGSYRLINPGAEEIKVIKSFVKPPQTWVAGVVA